VAIVVVGGHSRNIGKTSVVAGLIAALPELGWTALKITQYGHSVCSANGEPCDCATADHAIAISEERNVAAGTDTSRFLAAGARQVFWVRTRQGELAAAMPRVRSLLADAGNAIVESNSILRFLKPDLYLSVLDPAVMDFKTSALRYLDRADAILLPKGAELGGWNEVSQRMLATKRQFTMQPPVYCCAELVDFVALQLRDKTVATVL
jgi:hypothetical protein